jgi:hypothetical protein
MADFKFPNGPWTVENLGEEKYCEVAKTLGFFDPKGESADYRPSLDCGPFIEEIKRDNSAAKQQIPDKDKSR